MGKFLIFCRIKLKFRFWLYKKRFWLYKKRWHTWLKFQLEITSNKKVIAKKPLTNLYEMNSNWKELLKIYLNPPFVKIVTVLTFDIEIRVRLFTNLFNLQWEGRPFKIIYIPSCHVIWFLWHSLYKGLDLKWLTHVCMWIVS